MDVAVLSPVRRCEWNPSNKYIQAIKKDKKIKISVIFNEVLPELFYMHMQYVYTPQRVCDMTHAWPLSLYVQ